VSNLSFRPRMTHVQEAPARLGGAAGTISVPSDHGPGVRSQAEPQPAARRRRWMIGLLSAATAVWLAAQLWAGLAMPVQTWPVAGFPMFSEKRSVVGERQMEARTRSGRTVTVGPGDFGLTELQFLNYQRGMVSDAGMVKPQAAARLGRLAAIWNRQHPDDPAVSMTLTHLVLPLPYGAPVRSRQVIRWSET
jgi:hypothetical protein